MRRRRSKPFSFKEYRAIYSKVPRLCVIAAITTNEGIVMSLRTLASWNNQWHLPGGTVLYREALRDAVQRVALDEVGAIVNVRECLGYIDVYPSEEKEVGFGSSVSLVFRCELMGGKLVPDQDASEVRVFREFPANMVTEERDFLTGISFKTT